MSPRAYKPGPRRQLATEATRGRIIEAARALLSDSGANSFSIDAVASRADVARMTVYYQFKSKGKLLEALLDDFASRANMRDLGKAFQEPDTHRSLNILVEVFCRLWGSQRALVRRLNALAVLDPDVERALSERGGWRREAITQLTGRLDGVTKPDEVVDLLHVLTSFETYDALASAGRPPDGIVAMLAGAASAIVNAHTA